MKKQFGILTVLAITLLLAVGCKKINNDITPEAAAEGVTANFFDDLIARNVEEIATRCADESNAMFECKKIEDSKTIVRHFVAGIENITDSFDDEKNEEFYNKIAGKVLGKFDYEIVSTEVDGENAAVVVNLVMPSTNVNVNTESVLKDCLGFDIDDSMTMVYKAAEKKGMTPTEFASELSKSKPNEIKTEILELFSEELDSFIESVLEKRMENPQINKITVILKKQAEGDWKIVDFN